MLAESGLDWITVYPVNLIDAPAHPNWTAIPLEKVKKVPGLPTLSFGNVAKTLVELATNTALAPRHVLITTAQGWRSGLSKAMLLDKLSRLAGNPVG